MADDKSEKPTAQRLRKAREDGQYLSSRGMLAAVQFLAFVWIIRGIGPELSKQLKLSMFGLLANCAQIEVTKDAWMILMRNILVDSLSPLLPLGAVVVGASLIMQLAVTRLGFNVSRLTPNFGNFFSVTKLSNMPVQNIKSVAEAVFLIVVLAVGVNSSYKDQTALYLKIPFQDLHLALFQIGASVHKILVNACGAFILFGGIDIAFQYRRYMSQLKMSKQEIREENKRSDGDPHTKMRIRRMRRDLLRRQMMRQVPKATAVIVNPTHFAVAIRYEMDTMTSPLVVAKGKNWLALRIRHIATQNEVPIIENAPLARALYDAAEIGSAISPQFYRAIAEVLAYVYKLMGRNVNS